MMALLVLRSIKAMSRDHFDIDVISRTLRQARADVNLALDYMIARTPEEAAAAMNSGEAARVIARFEAGGAA